MRVVVRVLMGTQELGQFYARNNEKSRLHVYVGVSWADEIKTRPSNKGILANIGGHVDDWTSKRTYYGGGLIHSRRLRHAHEYLV